MNDYLYEFTLDELIFSFKIIRNWGDKSGPMGQLIQIGNCKDYFSWDPDSPYEYLVAWSELYDEQFHNRMHMEFEDYEKLFGKEHTKYKNFELTKEQFEKLKNIISQHNELVGVDSIVDNDICDGSHHEVYFCCDDFNRKVEGDEVVSLHPRDNDDFNYIDSNKAIKDSQIVSSVCQEIFSALEKFGIDVFGDK